MLNAWVGFAHPERKEIARYLLSRGLDPVGLAPAPARIAELLAPRRRLSFPRDWHRSRHPWIRRRCRRTRCPGPTSWSSPGLWTSWPTSAGAHSRGEPAALHRYTRHFADYQHRIWPHAPAATSWRLGSYRPTRVGETSVVCIKSELHLNPDGIKTGEGRATLPVPAPKMGARSILWW
jgi:hypothetical protein